MLSKLRISARGLCRPIGAAVLVASLIGGVAACSGKSDAELASEALNAGLTAQQAGDLETAQAQYKLCLKYEPNNKICLYDIGLLSQTAGLLADAENYYRMALASDATYTPAIFNLALVRDKLGDYQDAISLYQRYVQLVPSDPNGHLNLGYLLLRTGRATEGYAELAIAKSLNSKLVVPTAPPSSTASPTATPKPSASSTLSPSPTA